MISDLGSDYSRNQAECFQEDFGVSSVERSAFGVLGRTAEGEDFNHRNILDISRIKI